MSEMLPLAGITVLDVGQAIAGPLVGQILGDFGAEVIKIEDPEHGDTYRHWLPRKEGVELGWLSIARNKKSVTMNLREPRGVQVLKDLVAKADVVIQSFKPSTSDRLGISYEDLAAVNPRIIVVQVSGFGQTGPYRDRPGFGTLAEGMSGFAEMNGEADGPPLLPQFPLADSVAALYASIGVLTAVLDRDLNGSGKGQLVDVSLLEPLFSILGPITTLYDQLGIKPVRLGSRNPANAPRNLYQTKDGNYVSIAASAQQVARRCFEAIGRPELFDDPRYATAAARVEHVEEVDAMVGDWVRERSREEVVQVMNEHGVAAAPVFDIEDLSADPHVLARDMIHTAHHHVLGDVRMHGVVPRLSRTPGSIRSVGPSLGAHTDEVLEQLLRLAPDEIGQLRADGVI
ncbi:CaiB/BaiF CoA transferase family protein [Streptomyces sp. NPDC127079]|uniref:CaiB/BaiF CoA transferase family protein n=1 Tax=Streptomyces sp. NPDC127079 TaxID=3347132 RepID=UPI00365CED8A